MPYADHPRIPPLDPAEMTHDQHVASQLGADAVIRVLARHPDLLNAFQPLGGLLLFHGKLAPRLRELAILRQALRSDAPYEWANHVPAALGSGATVEEIEALGNPRAEWSVEDGAALRAVDELCDHCFISDATWTALSESLPVDHVIELIFCVGFYRMMAGFVNSVGVPLREGQPALGRAPQFHRTPSNPPAAAVTSGTGVGGTWNITFEHPSGNQSLILTLVVSDGAVSGSLVNPQRGIAVDITEGRVDGARVSFKAPMSQPFAIDISVTGVVSGDVFAGEVTIGGGGTFPFSGSRA